MKQSDSLLIIGAGHAGAELAVAVRQMGWLGSIELLGDEPVAPYQRPPLSKTYLQGKAGAESLAIRPAEAYAAAGVTLTKGARVVQIDRAGRRLKLADGRELPYTKLAICTGGRPRPFTADGMPPGGMAPNLHYLRTLADVDAIRGGLSEGARLVVVGGGYIGLELAASAQKLGAQVTVLEAQERVLARVCGEVVSSFYERVHREAGVDLRTSFVIQSVLTRSDGGISSLVGRNGERVEADLVVAGIGMLANVELAEAAKLEVDGGIVVDSFSRTSDPHIWAAGDCTVQNNEHYGRRVRLESVPNALEQARAAAGDICGAAKPNVALPWFWSDQYDLKLQTAGLSQGHDQCVVRGSTSDRKFAAFYLRAGILIAVDAVNRPADFMVAKRLVSARVRVDKRSLLEDESASLKQLVPAVPGRADAPTS